jgi:sulfide:quinone oxidoreductase
MWLGPSRGSIGAMSHPITPLRVVIAGGGIGALEALMALHDLGEQQFELTVVAPEDAFVLRPMAVAVPFSVGHANRIPLAEICTRFGARLHHAGVASVDTAARTVHCTDGTELAYDRLVLATGAAARAAYRAALTFDDGDPTALNGLLADIDEGYCGSVAIVIPPSGSWALPAYELALLVAREARSSSNDAIAIHLVTPETAPLAVFGTRASDAVAALLETSGIRVHTRAYATIDRAGEILLAPGDTRLSVQRILALPAIVGRPIAGIAADDHGFIRVDDHGRVVGIEDVYAVGDGADFPIKQGGLATQQADAAARDIAAGAGAPVDAEPFRPVLRGMLLTGAAPEFLRHDVAAGTEEGVASTDRLWWPPTKVVGHYLASFLAGALGKAPLTPPAPEAGIEIEVALPSDRDARPLALEPLGPLPVHGRW